METVGSVNPASDILNLSDDYVTNNLNLVYAMVKNCLTDSNDDLVVVRALGIAFGPCLELFDVHDLEEKLFRYACPSARKVFSRALLEFESFLNNCGGISSKLNCCEEIISSLIYVFRYFTLNGLKSNLADIGSPLSCSLELLYQSYHHCTIMEERYRSQRVLTDGLTLFNKAKELQNHVLKIMSDMEVTCEEYGIDLLNNILTFMYKAGMSLLQLDLKTMAELWKSYTHVVEKYAQVLKNVHEISLPVEWMTKNIVKNLENLISGEDIAPQQLTQTIKILTFMLRIVVKFSEIFWECLEKCFPVLLKLLICLIKISMPCIKILKISKDIDPDHLKPLTIGMEPLLYSLMKSNVCFQEFSTMSRNAEENSATKFAFLILCCIVLKKLISCDMGTRNAWFGSDDNILAWMFEMIKSCNLELCFDLKFEGTFIPAKQQRMTDGFEYLLRHISLFIMRSSSEEFAIAEKVLINHVLSKNPWCAMLAIDIWCILARFAEPELCYSQLTHLCRIFLGFEHWPLLPEKQFLESLISRLFPLLSQRQIDSLSESYPPSTYPHLWCLFDVERLSPAVLDSVETSLNHLTALKISKFLTAEEFDREDFTKMEAALHGSHLKLGRTGEDLGNKIASLWSFSSGDFASSPLNRRYLKAVCAATSSTILYLSSENIFAILQQMKVLTDESETSCRIYCLDSLACLGKAFIPPGDLQGKILNLVALLFNTFLRNENAFIRSRGMEIFSNFALVTCHTQVISDSVNYDECLKAAVTNYLLHKHAPFENVDNWKVTCYFGKLKFLTYNHVCTLEDSVKLWGNSGGEFNANEMKAVNAGPLDNQDLESVIFLLKKEAEKIGHRSRYLTKAQREEISSVVDLLVTALKL